MIAVFPILFIFWKFYKKTEFKKPEDVDLFQDLEEIEEYHRNFVETPPKYVYSHLRPTMTEECFADQHFSIHRSWFEKVLNLLFS